MAGLHRAALFITTALLVDLCFMLVNLPFLFVLISFPFALEHSLFYVLSLIPTGPSIAAAFAVTGRYLRLEQSQPFKEFFMDYWRNLKVGFLFWLIALPLLYFFFIDFFWVLPNPVGMIFFGLLFALWIMVILNSYAVLSRFEVTVSAMLRLGCYVLFTRPLKTFSAFSCIAIAITFVYLAPAIAVIFVFGLFPMGVMYYLNPVLDKIEKEFHSA